MLRNSNLDVFCVITTNYGPFVKLTGIDDEKISYLAGKLNLFEVPDKLMVKEINEVEESEMIFPFILSQAPIKPIIHKQQINEYSKVIKWLDKYVDILVIIGYSLSPDDNHINSLIRDYTIKENKTLIYCKYPDMNSKIKECESTVLNDVKTSLKIDDEIANIIPIIHNGDPTKLFIKISNMIEDI